MPGPNDPNADDDRPIRAPEPPERLAIDGNAAQAGDSEGAGAEPLSGGSGPLDGEK
jgi:hypothetical protein